MENIEIILSVLSTSIGLLISTITFVFKASKHKKAKLLAEGNLKIKAIVLKFIVEAEGLQANGTVKKQFVMHGISSYAYENDLKYDPELISLYIDDVVALTKLVNRGD